MSAADIGVMGQIADEAQEHVIDENRRRERHIGQVRAAARALVPVAILDIVLILCACGRQSISPSIAGANVGVG